VRALAHGDADAAAAALRECVEEGIFRRLTDTVAAEVDALVRLCKTKVVLVADGADEQGFKIAVVTRHAYVTVTPACVPACDARLYLPTTVQKIGPYFCRFARLQL
jgi:hypothetical protein